MVADFGDGAAGLEGALAYLDVLDAGRMPTEALAAGRDAVAAYERRAEEAAA